MLAGSFHQQTKDGFFLDKKSGYYGFLMALAFLSVIVIFMNSLGWLDIIYGFLKDNWNTSYVAAIILVILIIGFMVWITGDKAEEKKEAT